VPWFLGPNQIWWGETDSFNSGVGGTLWYKHGSSAIRDLGAGTSHAGTPGTSWNVKILAGADQYFTVRVAGVVIARIVYHHVESYAANF
jgi:hypothetical protein